MKMDLTGGGVVALAAVAAVGLGGLWVYSKRAAIRTALDPTSDKNLAYSGVNALGATVSGDKDWTLGGWLYDTFNKDKNDEIASMLRGSSPAAPPVNTSIMDRWDYYARGGQSAASDSGGASGGW